MFMMRADLVIGIDSSTTAAKAIAAASAAISGKPSKTFRLRTKNHRRYRELLTIHTELWPKLSAWNAKLATFAAGTGK